MNKKELESLLYEIRFGFAGSAEAKMRAVVDYVTGLQTQIAKPTCPDCGVALKKRFIKTDSMRVVIGVAVKLVCAWICHCEPVDKPPGGVR